jgi:mono/diheme cytochrome c family protein
MKFLIGLVIGVIVVPVAVFLYFISGFAPAATGDKPLPFEKTLAHAALDAHIEREMPKSVPVQADEQTFLAGAHTYRDNCAVCHGLPSGDQSPIAQGEFPKPPRLFQGKGVTDDEPGETYWKVANGIRLTGMPAFKGNLTDTQIWQVSLLVANADKISDAVKLELQPPATVASAPVPLQKMPPHKTR